MKGFPVIALSPIPDCLDSQLARLLGLLGWAAHRGPLIAPTIPDALTVDQLVIWKSESPDKEDRVSHGWHCH